MPKRDPAFLFYPGEWLQGTQLFSRSHKGAYMDILMAQFNNGHLALPDIQHILGPDFEPMWESKLKDKFWVDPNGLYYNDKLQRVMDERNVYKDGRLENLKGHKEPHVESHMDTPQGNPTCRDRDRDRDSNLIIDGIYKMYPSKRPNGSSTDKRPKDKERIEKHLRAGVDLKGLVELYVLKTNPEWYQALKTFLNGLPDRDELLKASDFKNQSKPQSAQYTRPDYCPPKNDDMDAEEIASIGNRRYNKEADKWERLINNEWKLE